MSGPNAISRGFDEMPPSAAPKPLRADPEESHLQKPPADVSHPPPPSQPGLGGKIDIHHSRANFPFLRPLGERVKRAFDMLG